MKGAGERPNRSNFGGSGLDRRRFLAVGATLLAAGRSSRAQAAETVGFGLTPVFLTSDLELLESLKAYLTAQLDRPVELVQRRTYQEITALLLSEQLTAAWICGFPYVQYRDHLELVAVPVWRGKPLYQSYLIVPRDRAAQGFADLRGDIHAFSDPDSNSGYLVTRALLAEMRETPSSYFGKFFFTYGHRNVVRAVASGLAESGSVDGYVWEVMRDLEPDLTAATRILRHSEWLGFPPIACARSLRDTAMVRRLSRALYHMAADETGRRVLEMLRLDAFAPADPEIFNGIAAKYDLVKSMG